MADALIGYTGFVGSALASAMTGAERYNSKNIEDIRGRSFGVVVIAAAPGAKWYANAHPKEDWRAINQVWEAVSTVTATLVVLISTVDVYLNRIGVDENTPTTTRYLSAYGINRLVFEMYLQNRFGDRLSILRLPALFGPGLKKNALYDLMTGTRTSQIAPNAEYQWYPVEEVCFEVGRAVAWREPLRNIVSEPISMQTIRDRFFPKARLGKVDPNAPKYDVKSLYSYRWPADSVLRLMGKFISSGDIKRDMA